MSILFSIGFYLLDLCFSLVLYVLWLRVGLRFFRVSWTNLIAKTVFDWTNRFVKPFSKLCQHIPSGRYDWGTLCLLGVVELLKFYVLTLMGYGMVLSPPLAMILLIGDVFIFPCQLLFYAMIFRVLMSWLPHLSQHPAAFIALTFTQPLMNWLGEKRGIIAGMDFGPWIWMIVLKGIIFVANASMPLHFG